MEADIAINPAYQQMSEIWHEVQNFRENPSEPGSKEMIERISKIMSMYEEVKEITINTPVGKRDGALSFLLVVDFIYRCFRDSDWEKLGRNRRLYGPLGWREGE